MCSDNNSWGDVMEPQHEQRAELWYGAATLRTIFADLEMLAQRPLPGEILVLNTNAEEAWEAVPDWWGAHRHAIVWKTNVWEGVREGAPALLANESRVRSSITPRGGQNDQCRTGAVDRDFERQVSPMNACARSVLCH